MAGPSELVAHTGFEPVISSLRGRCPRPLDECAATLCYQHVYSRTYLLPGQPWFAGPIGVVTRRAAG